MRHVYFASLIVFLLLSVFRVQGTEYFVSLNGADANPGTAELPWRTIQKAARTMLPGDKAIVRAGNYDERVVSFRGGESNVKRITFASEGTVVMKGWEINHPFISVIGFDITGHSSFASANGYVKINTGGDAFELLSCKIRDGVGLLSPMVLFTAPNTINVAEGGLLSAGFAPGQSMVITRGTNVALLNTSSYTIATVTDLGMTLEGTPIVNDGPKPAYMSASPNYALYIGPDTQGITIRSNNFSNLSYRYWFVQGKSHLFEGNVLEKNNGWDLIYFMGADHVFRGNHFKNNGWGTYQPSADILDNWSVKYERILFTRNFVQGLIGVINAQKHNQTHSGPLWITDNVFIDTGWFSGRFPDTLFENNTFLRVAREANRAVQLENHALIFTTYDYATNATILNNVFLDCGQPRFDQTQTDVGWYEIDGPIETVTTKGNFVAGAAPNYSPKTGWRENVPALNGGDPGFVNINDPLGPDGLPFTSDDGLSLRPDSKLKGAGVGGDDVGAYRVDGGKPNLNIFFPAKGTEIEIRWKSIYGECKLETADSVFGPWSQVLSVPTYDGSYLKTTLPLNVIKGNQFFRLSK